MENLDLSHHSAKFGTHRLCGIVDLTVSHLTSSDHVISYVTLQMESPHPYSPSKFCCHRLCERVNIFLNCDHLWPCDQRIMWLGKWGVSSGWVNGGCWIIFWMGRGRSEMILDRWGWMEHYFEWVGLCGTIFGWVGVIGKFFWASGGGWDIFREGEGRWDTFWVGR